MKKNILFLYLLFSSTLIFAGQAELDLLFNNLTALQRQADSAGAIPPVPPVPPVPAPAPAPFFNQHKKKPAAPLTITAPATTVETPVVNPVTPAAPYFVPEPAVAAVPETSQPSALVRTQLQALQSTRSAVVASLTQAQATLERIQNQLTEIDRQIRELESATGRPADVNTAAVVATTAPAAAQDTSATTLPPAGMTPPPPPAAVELAQAAAVQTTASTPTTPSPTTVITETQPATAKKPQTAAQKRFARQQAQAAQAVAAGGGGNLIAAIQGGTNLRTITPVTKPAAAAAPTYPQYSGKDDAIITFKITEDGNDDLIKGIISQGTFNRKKREAQINTNAVFAVSEDRATGTVSFTIVNEKYEWNKAEPLETLEVEEEEEEEEDWETDED